MIEVNDSVRSLWVPLRDVNMLLPSVSVAEVSNYQLPGEVPDTPGWLLGTITWRDLTVPVISLEVMRGHKAPANLVYSRILIINSIRPDSPIRFYAVVTAGLPRLFRFDESTIQGVETSKHEILQCCVTVNSDTAVIPDLDYIQGRLEQYRELAA